MQEKYGGDKKKKVLIHREKQHFDSADYEKTKPVENGK